MQLKYLKFIWVILIVAPVVSWAYTPQALMPDDIVRLCQSGKSEEVILSEIRMKGIGFEVNLPVMK